MSASRKVASILRMPWRKVAGTDRVPSLSSLGSRAATFARSRFFVPCIALAGLAAVDIPVFLKATSTSRSGQARLTPAGGAASVKHGLHAVQSPANGSAPPARLEFSTAQLNLGTGKPNEILRGELVLTNSGSEPTKFSLIKHCGCTELSPLCGELPPGGNETIHVGLQLAGYANSEKNTSIEVRAGEPAAVVARCVVSARCPAPFRVTPAFISFGSLATEELSHASHELQIGSVEGQPPLDADSLVIEHLDDAFCVERVLPRNPLAPDHSGATFRVSIKPGIAPGDHHDTLNLRLAGSDYFMRVPLNIAVVEPITVVPATVFLRIGEGAATKPVQLLVVSHALDRRTGEVSLVDGPPGVKVEDLGEVAPGRRRARLSVAAPTRFWPDEGEVRLRCTGVTFTIKIVKPKSF